MAAGRCDIAIVPRRRRDGAEVTIAVRIDRTRVIETIRALAATINMRVDLAPMLPTQPGAGDGEGDV